MNEETLNAICKNLGIPPRVLEGDAGPTLSSQYMEMARVRLESLRGKFIEAFIAPILLKAFKDELPLEQYRFPRSKKRRIRRKWAKNPSNYRPCMPTITWD